MFFKNLFFSLALLAIAPLALGGVCGENTGDNDSPGQFKWTLEPDGHYSGILEIGEQTFTIGGNEITTRAYRQAAGAFSIPGPTLVMEPGKKYVLSFHNTLPYELPSEDHNVFKDPNISNLHTHGLHISGESPSDDVTRFFEGGKGGDFVYDIPADHMGGTYWYHAHHHGSTFLQVSGGAFGLIIIDDCQDVGVPENVAAMQEKHLVFGFLDPDAAGTGGDTLISGTLSPSWTVNGKIDSTISMPANEWQHWRTLIADRDARQKALTIGANCEVELLARDGVWRTTAPKALPTNSVTMTGASRADLAVRCSGDSTISVGNQVVAGISVGTAGDPTPHPYADGGAAGSSWSVERPNYLRDLRGESGVNTETVSMGARTINGDKFDIDVPSLTLPADQVQEWTVKGATQHPFHLHIYHMQMMTDCKNYEGGEYYDVIATNCDVRFDLNANGGNPAHVYDGRTIMHCHILAHEDQGAMTWMDVLGGEGPPTFPSHYGYSAYYELAGTGGPPAAPSGLTANAVSSSQIDLAWNDNSDNESGFDIERSLDGTNFSLLSSVAADVTMYSDTGLAPNTEHFYRVAAVNVSGSAYSNTASATTQDAGGAALQVDSVTVSTVNQGRGQKLGRAVVVISDGSDPVAGATVTGDFTGTFNETGKTAETDANGTATIDTDGTAKGGISLTFCVTSVTDDPDVLPDFTGEVCGSL